MAGHRRGHCEQNNSKQETVLIFTKVLTITTNCTFRAKKVQEEDPQDQCPPLFKFVPAPLHVCN